MAHPRLLSQVLSPAEIGEWHAHLTLKTQEAEQAQRRANKRRRR